MLSNLKACNADNIAPWMDALCKASEYRLVWKKEGIDLWSVAREVPPSESFSLAGGYPLTMVVRCESIDAPLGYRGIVLSLFGLIQTQFSHVSQPLLSSRV